MFHFLNVNPRGRRVNDCTVRAISLATNKSWDETYIELSEFARAQAIMPDDIIYIDEYLERHFEKICGCKDEVKISVGEFSEIYRRGIFLITMAGHITCCIDGVIYDTFDPSDRLVWGAYRVSK